MEDILQYLHTRDLPSAKAAILAAAQQDLTEHQVRQVGHAGLVMTIAQPEESVAFFSDVALSAGGTPPLIDHLIVQSLDAIFRMKSVAGGEKRAHIRRLIGKYEDRFGERPGTLLFRGAAAQSAGNRAEAASAYTKAAEMSLPIGLPRMYLGAHSVVLEPFDWAAPKVSSPIVKEQITLRKSASTRSSATIVVGSDANYFIKFANFLLASLRQSHSVAPVHFHVVNWTDACEHVANALPEPFSISTEVYPHATDWAYFATVRFLRARQIGEALGPIYITDIDNQFVDNFDAILKHLHKYDAGFRMHYMGEWFPWWAPSGGNLWINSTPGGLSIASMLERYISLRFQPARYLSWWFDQLALNEVYHQCGVSNIVNLSDPSLSVSVARPYEEVKKLKAKY